tara:strand:+ start:1354 stop:1512 length:159 start_codon:yes stop_codon:yes gene_type:complete
VYNYPKNKVKQVLPLAGKAGKLHGYDNGISKNLTAARSLTIKDTDIRVVQYA